MIVDRFAGGVRFACLLGCFVCGVFRDTQLDSHLFVVEGPDHLPVSFVLQFVDLLSFLIQNLLDREVSQIVDLEINYGSCVENRDHIRSWYFIGVDPTS